MQSPFRVSANPIDLFETSIVIVEVLAQTCDLHENLKTSHKYCEFNFT